MEYGEQVALLKALTERQIRRREDILAAARKLLTKRGEQGVTMRALAKESGVAPKTLYHQFGSKEKLLRTAVEERFRYYYAMINEEEVAHGIDRLFYIIDTVAATTRKNLAYAKAMSPMLSQSEGSAFDQIQGETYRKAIDQIAEEGDFHSWVKVDSIAAIIARQISPMYLNTSLSTASMDTIPALTKLGVSLVLDSVTRGYTHKVAMATVKSLQKKLKHVR